MSHLAAAIWFLLAIVNHDGVGDRATGMGSPANSAEAVFSRTRIIPGLIDRECAGKASDSCYYVLFPCDRTTAAIERQASWRIGALARSPHDPGLDPAVPGDTVGL